MPTGGYGDDVDPAAVTGAAAGNVRRLTTCSSFTLWTLE
jgi:hypothetical protein